MIKPENLKRLAEYMGYSTYENKDSGLITITQGKGFFAEDVNYNPLANAEQDRELEIKFKFITEPVNDGWEAYIPYKNIKGKGKTPSEARLNAAIATIN